METKVAIIGAGELGQAISFLIRKGGFAQAELWDKDPQKVPSQQSVQQVVEGAYVVCMCIPSWAMRDGLEHIKSFLSEDAVVVSLAKGLEAQTELPMSAVLEQVLPSQQKWALLSGPMLAEELAENLPGAGVVASSDSEVFELLQKIFRGTSLSLTYSSDVEGVAMAGVLKNIYAIGLGIIEGLNLGCNAKGWYAYLALQELSHVMEILGSDRQTAYGVAGIGDFIATGLSPHSRNHQVGRELVATGVCSPSEGCKSLPSLAIRLEGKLDELPVISAISRIVNNEQGAQEAFQMLLHL